MNLFQEINSFLDHADMKFIITKKDGIISVTVQTYNENEQSVLPVQVRGTAEELDSRFIGVLKEPVSKTVAFLQNGEKVAADVKGKEVETKKPSGKAKASASKSAPAPKPVETKPEKQPEVDLFNSIPATEGTMPLKSALPKQDIKPNQNFDKPVSEPVPSNVSVATGEIKKESGKEVKIDASEDW